MKLTPIKIKGKGGPKKTWRPPNPQHTTRKRRRDAAAEGDEGLRRNPPRRTRFKSKKPAAAIEELPTEILERIIFMSRNLNFLRSSLRVGYRFSSRSFLTELVDAAFAPTWDVWYGHMATMQELAKMGPEKMPGDPEFQSAVLACPWLDVNLLLEAQAKWYRRTGGPRNRPPLPRDAPPGPDPDPAAEVTTRFEKNWKGFKVDDDMWREAEEDRSYAQYLVRRLFEVVPQSVEVHPAIRIPDRLLTGPYDWDAARMCFWLLRTGVRIPEACTWAWELTARGFQSILALEDAQLGADMLLLLAGLRSFDHWPHFLMEEKLAVARELEVRGPLKSRKISGRARLVLEEYCNPFLEADSW